MWFKFKSHSPVFGEDLRSQDNVFCLKNPRRIGQEDRNSWASLDSERGYSSLGCDSLIESIKLTFSERNLNEIWGKEKWKGKVSTEAEKTNTGLIFLQREPTTPGGERHGSNPSCILGASYRTGASTGSSWEMGEKIDGHLPRVLIQLHVFLSGTLSSSDCVPQQHNLRRSLKPPTLLQVVGCVYVGKKHL